MFSFKALSLAMNAPTRTPTMSSFISAPRMTQIMSPFVNESSFGSRSIVPFRGFATNNAADNKQKDKDAKEKEKEKAKAAKEKELKKQKEEKDKEAAKKKKEREAEDKKKKDESEKKKKEKEREKKKQAEEKERQKKIADKERAVKQKERDALNAAAQKKKDLREKEKAEKAARPKRPLSAYLLFTTQNPNLVKNAKSVAERAKIFGQQWKTLSDAQKKPYVDESETKRIAYADVFKQYKASLPKKPQSAYNIFCASEMLNRPKDTPVTEFMKTVGARWKSLSGPEKKKFETASAATKTSEKKE